MLLIKAAKCVMFGLASMPIAFGALATGIIFGLMNLGVARNPEMYSNIFTNSLIAFALVETFVFISVGISFLMYVLI